LYPNWGQLKLYKFPVFDFAPILPRGRAICQCSDYIYNREKPLIIVPNSTNLFIFPPYKFHFVDALFTNFHLPKSTLLALVSAFVSYPNLSAQAGTNEKFTDFQSGTLGQAYNEAIKQKYRFFSFGDAMMIK